MSSASIPASRAVTRRAPPLGGDGQVGGLILGGNDTRRQRGRENEMYTLIILAIGVFIGWNLPQPVWARDFQNWAVQSVRTVVAKVNQRT